MFSQIFRWGADFIVRPKVRLAAEFPLSLNKLGWAYIVSFLLFLLGSFAVPGLFLGLVWLLSKVDYRIAMPIFRLLADEEGRLYQHVTMSIVVASFLCGFGLQVKYLSRKLLAKDQSWRRILSLNADALRGSWWGATFWAVLWRSLGAFALIKALEVLALLVLPPPVQPTAELAKTLFGGSLLAFGLLAAVGAPLFEETVYRGFFLNSLRSSLRASWSPALADLGAVLLSAAVFSVAHFQFHPTTLILLFLHGCVLGELYRRSGSLYCPMLVHAMNNGLSVAILALGMG